MLDDNYIKSTITAEQGYIAKDSACEDLQLFNKFHDNIL